MSVNNEQKKVYKLRSPNSICFNGNFLKYDPSEFEGITYITAEFLINGKKVKVKVNNVHLPIMKSLIENEHVSIYNASFSQVKKISRKIPNKEYSITEIYLGKNCLILKDNASSSSVTFIGTFMGRSPKQISTNEITLIANFEITRSKFDRLTNQYVNETANLGVYYTGIKHDESIGKLQIGDVVLVWNAILTSQERTNLETNQTFSFPTICLSPESGFFVLSKNKSGTTFREEKENDFDGLNNQSLVEDLNLE